LTQVALNHQVDRWCSSTPTKKKKSTEVVGHSPASHWEEKHNCTSLSLICSF